MGRRQTAFGTRGHRMLYLAYQLQSDIMTPVRAWATIAAATGQPFRSDNQTVRNLTAAYELIARAGLTHSRPPFGISSVTVGNREVEVREEAAYATPFGTLSAFQEGYRDGAAARAVGGAALRPFRHAAAGDRAHHAARARRLHHRLAQCARRAADRRPLRRRRICRAPDQVPGSDGAGRARGRGVPALRRRARGRGGDGAGRQSGAAALDDADGRADRYPRQSDQGQRARAAALDRMVRAHADRLGADRAIRARFAGSIRASCSSPPS